VNIPNEDAPRTTPWTNFLTSVAEIEQQTGYTFFTALSGKIADDFRHRKCRIIPEFTDAALRNAISSARPDDNLLFIDSSPSHTVALTGGSLLIDKNLTIDASLVPGGVTIDAQGHSRILQAAPHTYTIFNSLTFTNGNATSTDAGGAILNAGYLHLYNCTFTRNQAGTGGAIWSTGLPHQDAGIWANKCAFTFNTATASGGSISSIGSGSCRFVNCMFLTNSSGEDGGAIQNLENAGLIVQECTFSGNHTDRHGGGISTASAGRVLIENSSFLYNNAGTQDGAIFTGSGDVTAANNNLVGNTVGRVGMLTSAVMLSTPHYVPITTAKKSRLLPPRLRSETF
jgi:hypothetical protein